MYYDSTMTILSIILPILGLAISLAILYFIIRAAIKNALREARREEWTEVHFPEKAMWLSERQRAQLAEHRDRNASPAA